MNATEILVDLRRIHETRSKDKPTGFSSDDETAIMCGHCKGYIVLVKQGIANGEDANKSLDEMTHWLDTVMASCGVLPNGAAVGFDAAVQAMWPNSEDLKKEQDELANKIASKT